MLGALKAIVAGLVSLASIYAAQGFGLDVPADAQNWLVNAVLAALTGGMTWLIPNIPS